MPMRDGVIVDWNHKFDIKVFLDDESLTDSERLRKIANLIEQNEKVFTLEDDDFAQDFREAAGWEDDDVEAEGNYVLDSLYNYADRNLIWLGP